MLPGDDLSNWCFTQTNSCLLCLRCILWPPNCLVAIVPEYMENGTKRRNEFQSLLLTNSQLLWILWWGSKIKVKAKFSLGILTTHGMMPFKNKTKCLYLHLMVQLQGFFIHLLSTSIIIMNQSKSYFLSPILKSTEEFFSYPSPQIF